MSEVHGSGRRAPATARRDGLRLAILLAVSVAAASIPASALAAPTITFIAPPGAHTYPDQASLGPAGYTEAPTAVRTTDQRPTIGIQADSGTQLQCHFDNVFTTVSCGGPAPGCPTTLCGSFQPSAPIGPDSDQFTRSHFLAVDVVDADGNSLASMWLNIDVDTTAPVTTVDNAGGVLTEKNSTLVPLRPTFTYQLSDSNSVGGNIDTASCSWAPAASPPAFKACPAGQDSNAFSPGSLPARHRLYRLVVRGTDDFGRSTTASAVYDPVPCVLTIKHPSSVAALLSSGIQTHLSCETLRHVRVAVYAFMVNGRRSTSPRGAVSDNPILGEYKIASRTGAITLTKRLRLTGNARSALRGVGSLGLVVAAGDSDKILGGLADGSLSYQPFTLHH